MDLTNEDYDRFFCPTTTYEIPDDSTLNDLSKVTLIQASLLGLLTRLIQMIFEKDNLRLGLVLLLWEVVLFIKPRHNLLLLLVKLNLNLLLLILLQNLPLIFECY